MTSQSADCLSIFLTIICNNYEYNNSTIERSTTVPRPIVE